ncbi:MAG: hypothetical protein NVSMB2_27420 [Chloroflexota bacterium]
MFAGNSRLLFALLRGLITPAAMTICTVPTVAVIAVIARLLGYGQNTLIGAATLISFFPI